MGINFSRLDLKTTEKSGWAPVPRQFPSASLAYTGTLVWDNPPPDAGANISIIPYVLGGVSKDFQSEGSNQYRRDVGVDAKISLTSSLNLDLTVNPDFSQVEVDRQVTNLDRFELFFPERRQFFSRKWRLVRWIWVHYDSAIFLQKNRTQCAYSIRGKTEW